MSYSYSSYIPWDIIPEVLSLLHAKYLLRFRTVSKRWRDLIDSPCFRKKHLLHSASAHSNSQLKLIIRGWNHIFTANLLNIVVEDRSIVDVTHISYPFLTSYPSEVLGCCNGLFCLTNLYDDIILWNPSTMRWQNIPKFTKLISSTVHIKFYGFGYDAANDDYKLVMISQFRTRDVKGDPFYYSQANIYSLKLDSWRAIEQVMIREFIGVYTGGIFAGNALNWTVSNRMEGSEKTFDIIAIDFGTEEFRKVAKPLEYESNLSTSSFLDVLAGKLCFICNYVQLFSTLNIWVMKDYGVESSWAKLVSISDTSSVTRMFQPMRPIAYSRCGKKVLMQKGFEELLWYDLEKKEVSYVKFHPQINFPAAYLCLDSLVHLKDSMNTKTITKRKRDVDS